MYSIANDNIYRDYIIEKSTSYNKKKEREKKLPRVRMKFTACA